MKCHRKISALLVAALGGFGLAEAQTPSPISRASVDSSGIEGDSSSGVLPFVYGTPPSVAVSADGRFVAFWRIAFKSRSVSNPRWSAPP